MRKCGRCGGIPRRDDPLECVQTTAEPPAAAPAFGGSVVVSAAGPQPTVTALTCRECLGLPAPRYPAGVARGFLLCGLCRRALRDDDAGEHMIRLADGDSEVYRPGAYPCCRDCYEEFRPVIHARLVANPPRDASGTGYQQVPALENFHGDWLL